MSKRAVLPPGPKESPVFGSLKHYLNDLPYYLLRLSREYGPMCTFHLGRTPVVLVNEPDLIEQILVKDARKFHKGRGLQRAKILLGEGLFTSEGDFHLRQRRMCQKPFTKKCMGNYQPVMQECAADVVNSFQDGEERDLLKDMMRLTLRVIGKTAFGMDLIESAPTVGTAFTEFLEWYPMRVIPGSELLDHLPVPSTKHIDHAVKELNRVILDIIRRRREDPTPEGGDFLSILMHAVDEEGDGTGMDDEQLRAEIMSMFLGGHETTANALAWCAYLLSLHPHIRTRVQEEVDTVLQGRMPTSEDYPNLVLCRQIFAEALRMYPPVWFMPRQALDDYQLGDYTIPKGATVAVSQLVTHYDHRFWKEPLAFWPERHTSEASHARPKYSYFPFSGGERFCLGEKFAWLEGVTVLAAMMQKWEFHYEGNRPVNYVASLTLRPKHGMHLTVKARK